MDKPGSSIKTSDKHLVIPMRNLVCSVPQVDPLTSIREVKDRIEQEEPNGGEEFALVMPYASKTDAGQIAERLIQRIRSEKICPNTLLPKQMMLTVSMGIAVYSLDGKNRYHMYS